MITTNTYLIGDDYKIKFRSGYLSKPYRHVIIIVGNESFIGSPDPLLLLSSIYVDDTMTEADLVSELIDKLSCIRLGSTTISDYSTAHIRFIFNRIRDTIGTDIWEDTISRLDSYNNLDLSHDPLQSLDNLLRSVIQHDIDINTEVNSVLGIDSILSTEVCRSLSLLDKFHKLVYNRLKGKLHE